MNAQQPHEGADLGARSARIGRAAIGALYAEIALYPKPGLVSPRDSGAHDDMDFSTFLRSLFSLRAYFPAIAQAGAEGLPFAALQGLGLAAEGRMLRATSGINTHRGAIFSLGLLAAASGALGPQASARSLAHHVARAWGGAILASGPGAAASHGLAVRKAYGARGAREEAAAGFPILIDHALPCLKACRKAGVNAEAAALQTLFVIVTQLDDTNLLHRGGPEGLAFAQGAAQDFLDRGGVDAPAWQERAVALHHAFVARRLSPGGAADMLAATLFLEALEGLA